MATVSIGLALVTSGPDPAMGRAANCGSIAAGGTVIVATGGVSCAAAKHVIGAWFRARCAARHNGCTIDGYVCRSGHGRRIDANRVTCRRGGRVITGVSGP